MTVYEAEKRWGIGRGTILKQIERKKIPAKKICNAKGRMVWEIPNGFPCPQIKQPTNIPSETTERRVLQNKGKHGYVARYAGTFTIRHMAKFLGVSSDKIRQIYDDIVAKGGF